ncbi:acyltransferase [Arthrobacter sp. UYEF36]|uniref:acyltransferase family protein n=1 Tax=Arthrobacter sp. UYEF36 TaxID=1756366 RepID=UPI00339629CA
MSTAAAARRPNLASLTGFRFFAALLVVLYHAWKILDPNGWLVPVAGFGHTAVAFFFILSGFLLTWSWRPGNSVRSFYQRRFARIWPAHALTTAIAVPVLLLTGGTIMWSALPLVLTLTQAWLPGDTRFAFNLVSWSLACEAFFYLMFPALILWIEKRGRLVTLALGIFAAMVIGGGTVAIAARGQGLHFLLYTMPAYRIGEFIIGMCLALALRRGWRPAFRVGHAVALTVGSYAGLMLVVFLAGGSPVDVPEFIPDLLMIPAFAALIAASAHADASGARQSFIGSLPMVKLGQWSFALYLVHFMLFKLAEPMVDGMAPALAGVSTVVLIAIAVGLSAALYEFFERPLEIRLRGRSRPRRDAVLEPAP